MRLVVSLILCAAIVVGGVLATKFIFATEPVAERYGAVRRTAMLVEVTAPEHGTFSPTIKGLGTVEASQTLSLSSRIAGRVTEVADSLVPGGEVAASDLLVTLDREDYRNVLEQRRAELAQAGADLRIEEGRGNVANYDLEVVGVNVADDDRDLVLREPQYAAAEARVDAARAALRQADQDLRRTRISAPFDAHVLRRDVEVGAQVSAGQPLAELIGIDEFWVMVTVPQARLPWLALGRNAPGSRATVRLRDWPEGTVREGRAVRVVGALDETTRLARVVVEVQDPLARSPENAALEPLMVGAFVEVEMEAVQVEDVVRIPRDYVRAGDTVWEMDSDDLLQIREVDIVFEDDDWAYISEGLSPDARVVTSNLATVRAGAELRLSSDGEAL